MVGRFVYRHVHQGLYGRLLTLTDADKQLKAGIENAQGKLAQYQDVAHQLDAFRARAFAPAGSRLRGLWRFMTLRPRGQAMALSAHVQIKHSLRDAVARQEISRRQGQIAYALAKQQIHAYVDAVCSASQLKGWERLFSLWHLVHLPFLYLLLFSGIVHVIAVHMY